MKGAFAIVLGVTAVVVTVAYYPRLSKIARSTKTLMTMEVNSVLVFDE
ncbi:MAG: hypothetical protein JWQ19_2096 [Subtercola sp.]|nr:hypothetical protein [Subtercola sp.]